MSLVVTHDAGFFSCCSVKLQMIITYIHTHRCLPHIINGSKQFSLYKANPEEDVTYDFFDEFRSKEEISWCPSFSNNFQYKNYRTINFSGLQPVLSAYFTPSKDVLHHEALLFDKYKFDPENTIGVYYRGTDKIRETNIATFADFERKVEQIWTQKEDILLLTDSQQMADSFQKRFPTAKMILENKLSSTNRGIHFENRPETNYADMMWLFASFLILSKSAHLVCTSGNCSLWIALYRGHNKNIHQNHNKRWI